MRARTRSRTYAAFGFVWILGIVGYVIFGTDAPVASKVAFAEYGGIGLVHMAGTWRGRDKDEAWNRRMRRVQWAGFIVAVGLSILGALTLSN